MLLLVPNIGPKGLQRGCSGGRGGGGGGRGKYFKDRLKFDEHSTITYKSSDSW